MALRRRVRGSGITKRPEILFLGPDGHIDVEAARFLAEANTFERWVKIPEKWAREVLVNSEWVRGVLIKAGYDATELDDTKILLFISQEADKSGTADSDEDFAARLLYLIFWIRDAIKAGAADRAAADGVRLGELVALYYTKKDHEGHWRTGTKQRRWLKDTRDKWNAEQHAARVREWARWNEEAAQVWKRHPNFKPSAVARLVAKNLKLHENVRSIAHRLKKPAQAG